MRLNMNVSKRKIVVMLLAICVIFASTTIVSSAKCYKKNRKKYEDSNRSNRKKHKKNTNSNVSNATDTSDITNSTSDVDNVVNDTELQNSTSNGYIGYKKVTESSSSAVSTGVFKNPNISNLDNMLSGNF